MAKKRERVELIHDILKAVCEHGGSIKPTHLLYKANLSYDALKYYAEHLMSCGLLGTHEQDGHKRYVLTERGQVFLEQYRRFRKVSDNLGI